MKHSFNIRLILIHILSIGYFGFGNAQQSSDSLCSIIYPEKLTIENKYLSASFKQTDSVDAVYFYKGVLYNRTPCYTFTDNSLFEEKQPTFFFGKLSQLCFDEMDSIFFSDGILSGCLIRKFGLRKKKTHFYFKNGLLSEVIFYKNDNKIVTLWDFSELNNPSNPQPVCEVNYNFFEEELVSVSWCFLKDNQWITFDIETPDLARKTPGFLWRYFKNRQGLKRKNENELKQ